MTSFRGLKHDWMMHVGGWRFGIVEFDKVTTVFVGPSSYNTGLSAYSVLVILVLGMVIVAGIVSFVIAGVLRKRKSK